ncbi:type II toxin-antitoxin system RelE/ParE family toxin [Pseudomonas sp. PSKL.D1]|uniref:type II toxin-antitoxin system RelE/ParE family toxin n=1 Tax=Pseudomonas sp. PSKL.D1 TaxID=3029060 RepID=UPI002380CB87|nr:type II toxin-antitoxin system RelE/ParE family toxin [Pseudomonas sp. PSKL.D1]WDY60216.1 type II toxin-antitoxin system RelE/ParE family toxin [Pseudomonas sp. PSKL.D1]
MEVFKRRDFARWQMAQRLTDSMLCQAVNEMRLGLIDASLGCFLWHFPERCNQVF